MSMIGKYRRISPMQLADLIGDPDTVVDFLFDETEEPAMSNMLDIDKSWHAIHFLLNGDSWSGEGPSNYAVLGGTEIGEDVVGYGPARYLVPKQVSEASSALAQISREALLFRFNLQRLREAEIYPHGWEGSTVEKEYIGYNYDRLISFFSEAAQSGDAMLIYIS